MPFQRYLNNPIIKRSDIPDIPPRLYDVSSVFNPGAIQVGNRVLLLLRVQNRGRETFIVPAWSEDGIHFQVEAQVISWKGLEKFQGTIFHLYDPRITALDGRYFIVFAMDTDNGCRLGIGETNDFTEFEFIGLLSDSDSRNGVLFSEKIDGEYLLIDRPNRLLTTGDPFSGDTIVLSRSSNLIDWHSPRPLITGNYHYWDERIGAGPPPIKTRYGWLLIYHGVATHFASAQIYQAGVILLDLHDPSIVLTRSRYNILEPRETYELIGQVPNVVFPSGAIVQEVDTEGFPSDNSIVRIYYGAADTCVGTATATIRELIADCNAGSNV